MTPRSRKVGCCAPRAVPPHPQHRRPRRRGDASRGLQPVRHYWHRQIDLAEPEESGPVAAGIEIGGVRSREDRRAVHAVLTAAFTDHWDHRPEPFDRWDEQQTTNPSYDPTLWLLARAVERPVGALTGNAWDDDGWVDELGVLASHRGRGIATALLRRAFATFSGRGARRVRLNVDAETPSGATALYEPVGMRVVKRWDLWECAAGPSRSRAELERPIG